MPIMASKLLFALIICTLVCLFRTARLLVFENFPASTFIPDRTFIPVLRVLKSKSHFEYGLKEDPDPITTYAVKNENFEILVKYFHIKKHALRVLLHYKY